MKMNQVKTLLTVVAVFDMVYVGVVVAEDIICHIKKLRKKKQKTTLTEIEEDDEDDLDYEWLDEEDEEYDDGDAEGMVM
ncbi:MAG: hypothetical protein LUE92_05860 [Clostridiales bacterium]|nr:hypothetical protein [Clostridiales bacterium]